MNFIVGVFLLSISDPFIQSFYWREIKLFTSVTYEKRNRVDTNRVYRVSYEKGREHEKQI